MRKDLLCAATLAFFVISGTTFARQNAQGQPSQQAQQEQQNSSAQAPAPTAAASQSTTQAAPAPVDSLAEAARKAREQKKEQANAKPARVFDNETIPKQGNVSTVGASADVDAATAADGAQPADGSQAAGSAAAGASPSGNDEKTWRDEFAKLRHKLEQDTAELAVMQRELGVLDVQYYPDPVTGMQQQLTRSDINEKTAAIEAKKKTIEADNQAIADAEDRLHKAGGDSGWAR
jgi:hypothetical protein